MYVLLKLFYLILFCSLDIALYLRLPKGNAKANVPLTILAFIWLIIATLYLPAFHIDQLMSFRFFGILSGIVVQLILVYYIGVFAMRKIEASSTLPDLVKQSALTWLHWVFEKIIFAVFLIVHILWITLWSAG